MSGKHITWRTTQELADLLSIERDALNAQIAALRALPPDESTDEGIITAVICEYLITGSPATVAKWADAKGWRLPNENQNGKKSTLKFDANLVRKLVQSPPSQANPALIELCRRVFAIKAQPAPWAKHG